MERQLLENLAAESDPRTTAIDYRWWDAIKGNEARMTDEYTESGTWIPIRFEVCPLCEGRGKHVNPSIDAHGLTAEDFEDEDFRESYRSGDYDVRCTLCQGENVVPVPRRRDAATSSRVMQPRTAREIYRLGHPIPFPTTIEEFRDQLIWALDELHQCQHIQPHSDTPLSQLTLEDTGSPPDRMAIALRDPRFACPDPWHLVYQPGNDGCPSCGHAWIATVRS